MTKQSMNRRLFGNIYCFKAKNVASHLHFLFILNQRKKRNKQTKIICLLQKYHYNMLTSAPQYPCSSIRNSYALRREFFRAKGEFVYLIILLRMHDCLTARLSKRVILSLKKKLNKLCKYCK